MPQRSQAEGLSDDGVLFTREHPSRTGRAQTAYVYETGPVGSSVLDGFEVEAADLFTRP